jgi:phage protein D
MVNVVKKPVFLVVVNGKDITPTLLENDASISLTDEANEEADQLTITVVGAIKRPQSDDVLELWMGYDDKLVNFGTFVVQETTKTDDFMLSISATGVNFSNALKMIHNITYENVTVKEICTQVAERHGLQLHSDYDDVMVVSLAQSNESDIHFMNRMAKEYNAIFNIKKETLVFMHKYLDHKPSPTLPRYIIFKREVHQGSLSVKHTKKPLYTSCKCTWHDTKENVMLEVVAGEGEPCLNHRGQFKDEAEALNKANALLDKSKACNVGVSLGMEGRAMFAGGIVNLEGTLEDDGEFAIKTISHTMDSNGWSMGIEMSR